MTLSLPIWVLFAVLAVTWLVCGVLEYGFMLAYFQREYPSLARRGYLEDRKRALVAMIGGPFFLLIDLLSLPLCGLSGGYMKHGLMFVPDWEKEDRTKLSHFLLPRDEGD